MNKVSSTKRTDSITLDDDVRSLNEKLTELGYFPMCRFDIGEDGEVIFIDEYNQDCFIVPNEGRAERIIEELCDYAFRSDHERRCLKERCSICGRVHK
jgi:hypothetical protein